MRRFIALPAPRASLARVLRGAVRAVATESAAVALPAAAPASSAPSGPVAQHAALACFTPESMAIYHQRKDEFRARRDYIVPALKALGFGVPVEPDGAFYVYLDCSAFSTDSTHFAHHMLQEIGVAMTPGLDFGVDAPERYLRLSYATQMNQLRDAVERMKVWLPTQRIA